MHRTLSLLTLSTKNFDAQHTKFTYSTKNFDVQHIKFTYSQYKEL